MIFVADESVDYNLIQFLRKKELDIYSIQEKIPSANDLTVLKIAAEKYAVLITEDKDFGELIFKLKLLNKGILLLRIQNLPPAERFKIVFTFISKYSQELVNNFSVLKNNKLRIRKI